MRIKELYLLVTLVLTCIAIPADAWAACKRLGWIITAKKARQHHAKGALFLDLRKLGAYRKRHVKGAQHTTWQRFSSRKLPHVGRLHAKDAVLQRALRSLGVSNGVPVIAYGNPRNGWGEEGRITWMLRSLGHRCAAFVDGGFAALTRANIPLSQRASKPTKGHIVVKRTQRWSIDRQRLQRARKRTGKGALIFVDTREKREYRGATPYGEARGGHIPGARHLHYKTLLNRKGFLKPRKILHGLLSRAGIAKQRTIVAYCTGGIRSAWFVSVLISLGYTNAKNYAGSMWEWSAYPASTHPLQRPKNNAQR